MGLFTFIAVGIGFVLVDEAMASSNSNRKEPPNSLPSFAINCVHLPTQSRKFLPLNFFLLYSVAGILFNFSRSISFPSSLVCLISLFAFVEEFLLFHLQRKDPDGIENRYYDHMLVPISICFFSTSFELKYPKSNVPKLSRGIGLILQGTWFVQMDVSFFTGLLAQGCSLDRKTRGNYTIKCNGHPNYHRARAIATLQFNCHLAHLVTLIVGAYSIICKKNEDQGGSLQYKRIGSEMQSFENRTQFTLDSDDDMEEEIREEHNDA